MIIWKTNFADARVVARPAVLSPATFIHTTLQLSLPLSSSPLATSQLKSTRGAAEGGGRAGIVANQDRERDD